MLTFIYIYDMNDINLKNSYSNVMFFCIIGKSKTKGEKIRKMNNNIWKINYKTTTSSPLSFHFFPISKAHTSPLFSFSSGDDEGTEAIKFRSHTLKR